MKRLPSNYNALVNRLAQLEDRADVLQQSIIVRASSLAEVRMKIRKAKRMIEGKEKAKDPSWGEEP